MEHNHHPEFYYIKALLSSNPSKLIKMETVHVMMLFFFIDGLHILDKSIMLQENSLKSKLIQYLLELQLNNGSFTCSSLYQALNKQEQIINKYGKGHIVFTYSAINSLYVLNALDKVDKSKVLASVKACRKQDGSFSCFPDSSQCDLRFVYSALSICKLFNDFQIINVEKTKLYINSCVNYDGGFGLRPKTQSHSGAIFCAVASYVHLNQNMDAKMQKKVLNFLVNRQSTQLINKQIVGVQGRVGKLPDSCYSFWVGASIMLITDGINLLNPNIKNFLMMCFKNQQQSFAKYPSNKCGDPVHTFHSVMGLKIISENTKDISLSQLLKIEQNRDL